MRLIKNESQLRTLMLGIIAEGECEAILLTSSLPLVQVCQLISNLTNTFSDLHLCNIYCQSK